MRTKAYSVPNSDQSARAALGSDAALGRDGRSPAPGPIEATGNPAAFSPSRMKESLPPRLHHLLPLLHTPASQIQAQIAEGAKAKHSVFGARMAQERLEPAYPTPHIPVDPALILGKPEAKFGYA